MTTETSISTTRIETLIALTEDLSVIFEKENELLRTRRPQEILPLQEDKARLAAAYAQSIRDVAQDRADIAGANSALLETLRDITRRFEKNANEQRALLDGARHATEGVLRAIADEAENENDANYADKSAAKSSAPIVLNERA